MHQLPVVGSCVLTGQWPRAHVCAVVNFCCVLYKDSIFESNIEFIYTPAIEKKICIYIYENILKMMRRLLPVYMLNMELQRENS